MFKKLILEENVKAIVVTGKVSLFEKGVMAAAKQSKIPVIKIDHGIRYHKKAHSPLIGETYEAVMSETTRRNRLESGNETELGIKKENIIITGPVVYDKIHNYMGSKKKNERNVLVATAPFIETGKLSRKAYFKRISRLLKEIKKIPGTKVNFKLHPREEHYKKYKELIKKNKYTHVKVFKSNISREDFYSLIRWCDVFIHFGSNSSLEAMIIDRPIVTIDILDKDYPIEYWLRFDKETIYLDYKGDIKKAVERALKNDQEFSVKRKKNVENYCGRVDGKASERVVSLIERVAR